MATDSTSTPDLYNDTDSNSTSFTTEQSQTTRVDIASIIQERDSLKQEADSLRGAVIFLGIFSVLALIAAIAFIVWVVLRKRRSGKMESNTEMHSPTANNRPNAAKPYSRISNSPQGTHTSTSSEIGSPAQARETAVKSSHSKENIHKEQTANTKTSAGVVDKEIVSKESKYIAFNSTPQPDRALASGEDNAYTHCDDDSDKEIYEIVGNNDNPSIGHKVKLTTHKGNIIATQLDANATPPKVAQEVYANCKDEAEYDDTYCDLDLDRQNSHHAYG